jgi:hypothetical protein
MNSIKVDTINVSICMHSKLVMHLKLDQYFTWIHAYYHTQVTAEWGFSEQQAHGSYTLQNKGPQMGIHTGFETEPIATMFVLLVTIHLRTP